MINAYAAGNVGTGQSYTNNQYAAADTLGGIQIGDSMNFNNDALNQRIAETVNKNAFGQDTLGRAQMSSSINRTDLIRV